MHTAGAAAAPAAVPSHLQGALSRGESIIVFLYIWIMGLVLISLDIFTPTHPHTHAHTRETHTTGGGDAGGGGRDAALLGPALRLRLGAGPVQGGEERIGEGETGRGDDRGYCWSMLVPVACWLMLCVDATSHSHLRNRQSQPPTQSTHPTNEPTTRTPTHPPTHPLNHTDQTHPTQPYTTGVVPRGGGGAPVVHHVALLARLPHREAAPGLSVSLYICVYRYIYICIGVRALCILSLSFGLDNRFIRLSLCLCLFVCVSALTSSTRLVPLYMRVGHVICTRANNPNHPPPPPPQPQTPKPKKLNVNLVNSGRITEVFAFEATSVAVQDRFAPALGPLLGGESFLPFGLLSCLGERVVFACLFPVLPA
jgi:hypothetical protein